MCLVTHAYVLPIVFPTVLRREGRVVVFIDAMLLSLDATAVVETIVGIFNVSLTSFVLSATFNSRVCRKAVCSLERLCRLSCMGLTCLHYEVTKVLCLTSLSELKSPVLLTSELAVYFDDAVKVYNSHVTRLLQQTHLWGT